MTRISRLSIAALSLAALALSACGANESAAAPTTAEVPSAGDMAKLNTQLPVLTGADVWTMDAQNSTLTFDAYFNGDFTGEFTRFQTAIKLDPDALATAEIHAVIDLTSVAAKDDDVRANLLTKDWFHTALHPYAVFSSKMVRREDSGTYVAAGDLTIKGGSKPVDLAFALTIDGDTAHAKGSTSFSRMNFNVGEGADFASEDWVKFGVNVNVDIMAEK
jgi:polyisoprenoid-binding protein YceI